MILCIKSINVFYVDVRFKMVYFVFTSVLEDSFLDMKRIHVKLAVIYGKKEIRQYLVLINST